MTRRRGKLPRNQVLIGDTRELLDRLPADNVDCVITSPPYLGLRDYGHDGQMGLESNVAGWVAAIRRVCRQIGRVLRPTGALWLNVGDGYSAHPREGAAIKSLLLGPQRLAIALAEDGWIVRNQVIWAKTNAMPHPVRDRLSNTYEVMFLLVRERRYFFDLDTIRVPAKTGRTRPRPRSAGWQYPPPEAVPNVVDLNQGLGTMKASGQTSHPLGRNPGDVWRCATASYHGAHFATFPAELIRPALLATCPEKVCVGCGIPWQRGMKRRGGRLLAIGELRPNCECGTDSRPGLVLDPFLGSGTVALVCEEQARDWLGIELNPAYAALAERRVADWRAAHNKHTTEQEK